MASILIIGSRKTEREGLTLFMEFAGHRCRETDSLDRAKQLMESEMFDLVLAEAPATDEHAQQTMRALRKAFPTTAIIVLTEEPSSPTGNDDVITAPLTLLQSVSPPLPPVRKSEALLMLLPEKDALKMLRDLPHSAGLLNKLGLLYHSQKKYTAADQLYRLALQLSGDSAERGREKSSILMNLAGLCQDQKKYGDAEGFYKQSLQLAEQAYGPNHVKVARRLRRLAEVYRLQGKSEEAAPFHQRLREMGVAPRA